MAGGGQPKGARAGPRPADAGTPDRPRRLRRGVAVNTTITRDNEASWALFRSFARRMGGDLSDEAHYKRDDHFDGQHATEHMVTITLPDEGDVSSAA